MTTASGVRENQDVLSASELLLVLEDMMTAPAVREVYDELKLFLGIRESSRWIP